MIRTVKTLSVVSILVVLVLMGSGPTQAQCIPTAFFLDGINLTAALINPTTTVTGAANAGAHRNYYDFPSLRHGIVPILGR